MILLFESVFSIHCIFNGFFISMIFYCSEYCVFFNLKWCLHAIKNSTYKSISYSLPCLCLFIVLEYR